MPREFKLIESYPHPSYRLKEGMIIDQEGSIYVHHIPEEEACGGPTKLTFGKEIENYPKYWEEIIELPKLFTIEDMRKAYLLDKNKVNFVNWLEKEYSYSSIVEKQ